MPGPIAHAAAAYLVYRAFRPSMPAAARHKVGPVPLLLVGSVGLSFAPDLDAVPAVLLADFARFHNHFTHSLIAGLAMALAVGAVARVLGRPEAVKWGFLALVCYQTHLVLDLFTFGHRGQMLLWPLTDERFQGPVTLFYGVRWSEGLISAQHLITLGTETGLAAAVFLLVKLVDRVKLRQRAAGPPVPPRP